MKMYLEVFMMKPFRVPAFSRTTGNAISFRSVRIFFMRDETEETFQVSAELKAVLLESIAQCERGETIQAEQLFQEMLDRESEARIVPSAKPA